MLIEFPEKIESYLRYDAGVHCVVPDTPEDVLESIRKTDQFYFDAMGEHLIQFHNSKADMDAYINKRRGSVDTPQ